MLIGKQEVLRIIGGGLDERRKEERKKGMEDGRTDGQMIECLNKRTNE